MLILAAVLVGIAATQAWQVAVLISVTLVVLAAFLRWSSKFAALVGGLLESGVEVGGKSLEEVKFELSESLRTLQAPLLVVIDDVDRLIPAEVRNFFNSSKSMPTSRISFTCSSLIEPRSKRMSRKCFQ